MNFHAPLAAPLEIIGAFRTIREFSVANAEIVGRRGDDEIDRVFREPAHPVHAVFVVKLAARCHPEARERRAVKIRTLQSTTTRQPYNCIRDAAPTR